MEDNYSKPTELNMEADVSGNETPPVEVTDWKAKKEEIERRKGDIRNRIHSKVDNYDQAKEYFIPARPAPSIDDEGHKRVAVYARVSTSSEDQISSIENQTIYYTKKIEESPNWELQEIYSDEGKSGTSMRHRDEFKRMMENAKDKKMDLIVCASVSRFARNVSDCLEQVAQLKTMNPSHPVGVYFETENIYTLSPDSDQALGIHALLADWESGNKSRRMILSYDQRIMTGQYPLSDLLGYRHTKDGELIMVPDEAKTVKFAFLAYINGYSYKEIADILTAKERKTMQGRQVWNESMVQNILQNERRWGDLRARKTIVIDYKHGKTKKNDREERCGAYVPNHHEGIVTPGIAKAAQYLHKSSDNLERVQLHSKVITSGALQGFVNINPYWAGVSNESLFELSRNAYTDVELADLYERRDIIEGEKHSKAIDMSLGSYQVSYGIYYLKSSMPSLTFTNDGIRFNPACHKKFDNCSNVEMYYHPVLQMVIIRKSDSEDSFAWVNSDNEPVGKMSAKGFSTAVYENMEWRKDYSFRFRGITKVRGDEKIMMFFLDEPQILLGSKQKKELEQQGVDLSNRTSFVPYRDESYKSQDEVMNSKTGYPAEWNHSIGMSYELKNKREQEINRITAEDIKTISMKFNNPLLGDMPEADEIDDEVNALLMSM